MTSHTAGHETRIGLLGEERLDYPPDHIEADNRLSWLLGRLEDRFGDEAYYVHLTRDATATAQSFVARYGRGIMRAYRIGIIHRASPATDRLEMALDYVHTVDRNIAAFLQGKPHVMTVRLEHAKEDFRAFWDWVGATGDLDAALAEWDVKHDATDPAPIPAPESPKAPQPPRPRRPLPVRIARKSARAIRGLPGYLRGA
ncbi:MAG: hypothetical protein ABWZ82_03255 [Candidatus Limnocylindrales bacterium]